MLARLVHLLARLLEPSETLSRRSGWSLRAAAASPGTLGTLNTLLVQMAESLGRPPILLLLGFSLSGPPTAVVLNLPGAAAL